MARKRRRFSPVRGRWYKSCVIGRLQKLKGSTSPKAMRKSVNVALRVCKKTAHGYGKIRTKKKCAAKGRTWVKGTKKRKGYCRPKKWSVWQNENSIVTNNVLVTRWGVATSRIKRHQKKLSRKLREFVAGSMVPRRAAGEAKAGEGDLNGKKTET